MASTLTTLRGSCACGACTYTYTHPTPPEHLDFCYCTMCQRSAGAPFMAWMGVARSGLALSGPSKTVRLSVVAARTFCGDCGGCLTLQYDCYPEKTHLAAATVTEGGDVIPRLGVHIFVKSCPKWYRITEDGVERWEGFDGVFRERFPEVVEMLGEVG